MHHIYRSKSNEGLCLVQEHWGSCGQQRKREASLLRLGTGSHKAGSNTWHCLQSNYKKSIMSREIKDSTETRSRCSNQSYKNLILQVADSLQAEAVWALHFLTAHFPVHVHGERLSHSDYRSGSNMERSSGRDEMQKGEKEKKKTTHAKAQRFGL